MAGLAAGTLTTAIIGIVPPLHLLWAITAILAAALVAYMALLINLRNIAAERRVKLHYLPYAGVGQLGDDRYAGHLGTTPYGYGSVGHGDRVSALAHASNRYGEDRSPLAEEWLAASASGTR